MKKRILLLVLFAACSPERSAAPPPPSAPPQPVRQTIPPPAAADAQRIVGQSAEFSEYEFTNASVSLPMRGTLPPYLAADARQLAGAGWLRSTADGFALTEKAKSDKRFLPRSNGTLDVVPLAKKELTGVTAVTPNSDGTVNAAFTWRWIPNDVGQAFKRGPIHDRYAAPQKATAKLMWDGSAWTVLRITPG